MTVAEDLLELESSNRDLSIRLNETLDNVKTNVAALKAKIDELTAGTVTAEQIARLKALAEETQTNLTESLGEAGEASA